LHGDTQTGNDIGAMTGGGSLGDMLDRSVFGGGVVFGDPEDSPGNSKTDQGRDEDVNGAEGHPISIGEALRKHLRSNEPEGDAGQYAGGDQTLVECRHDLLAASQLDEEGTDDGG